MRAPVIDAHHHLWTADYPWLAGPDTAAIRRDYTMADLVPHLDSAGVAATVLVEAGRHTTAEVASFLALAGRTPRIAGVVAWASLADPDLTATIAGYRDLSGGNTLVGIRGEAPGPDDHRALAAIGAAGLPYDLLVREQQLADATAVVRATPDTMFVLDHLGKPPIRAGAKGLARWRVAIAGLATCDNVVAKLSGLLTEAGPVGPSGKAVSAVRPYVETALELFGPDRLMLGSDWPVVELVGTYGDALATVQSCLGTLAVDERTTVESGTASRIYRLPVLTTDRYDE